VVGEIISVKLQMAHDGRRNFKGQLVKNDDQCFTLLVDNERFELAIDNVLKANLVPQFD
jgi:ribosome maturation factor RimP